MVDLLVDMVDLDIVDLQEEMVDLDIVDLQEDMVDLLGIVEVEIAGLQVGIVDLNTVTVKVDIVDSEDRMFEDHNFEVVEEHTVGDFEMKVQMVENNQDIQNYSF